MADWRSMRASGTDRERAADLLRAAHGEGRLPWPEYSARLERLMSSTTHGEIHQVVSDLISTRQHPNGQAASATAGGPESSPGGNTGPVSGPGGPAGGGPAPGQGNFRTIDPRLGPTRGGSRGGGPRSGPGHRPPTGQQTTERLASAAVLCGTLVPFTLGISGIPAVVLGHLVRHRLKRAPELAAAGNSAQMATAALVLGYFPIVVGLGILAFLLTR